MSSSALRPAFRGGILAANCAIYLVWGSAYLAMKAGMETILPLLLAGALLFLGGHGFLYWGQQRLSSGLGAVLFATIPLWVVLIEGFSPTGIRLGWRALSGLGLGTLGVLTLVGPARLLGQRRADVAGAVAISIASLSWAVGSIYTTRACLPASAALAGGMEMFCGGALLLLAAVLIVRAQSKHPSPLLAAEVEAQGAVAR